MGLTSLQWRLILFICIIAICLLLTLGIVLSERIDSYYYEQFVVDLTEGYEQYLEPLGQQYSVEEIYDRFSNIYIAALRLASENKSFTIVDARTNQIFSNDLHFLHGDETEYLNQLFDSPNFIAALAGRMGREKITQTAGDRDYYDCAFYSEGVVYYFTYYKDEWKLMINELTGILISTLFITLGFSLILGLMLANYITKPINGIMRKAENIAFGNFGRQLPVQSNDEIGRLTTVFNNMSSTLKEKLDDIASEKNKVETILNYMTEGVVAYDIKGNLLHINPAARDILVKKTLYVDLKSFMKFLEMEESTPRLKSGELVREEKSIQIEDRTFRVYFVVFKNEQKVPEGIIVVLVDLTKQQALDNIRKEFVANVSHELKTPLASIKMYTETLLSGMDNMEQVIDYLHVINAESDRMNRLVTDLILLSRFDNKKMMLEIKKVNILKLLDGCVKQIRPEADEKGHRIEMLISPDLPFLEGDYHRLEQVMINVLINAVKYTPREGSITVFAKEVGDSILIKVNDNGIGIPQKDLPRIFERFHRVDKARSRDLGGTGLGLSISKEIVESHGGTIEISAVVNKGTEVRITLPIKQSGQKVSEAK